MIKNIFYFSAFYDNISYGDIMKKIISIFLASVLILSLTACAKDKSTTENADNKITDIKDERTSDETTSESTTAGIVKTKVDSTEYGKSTGTSKTLTGLEPLPLVDFKLLDADNKEGLSTEKIPHSFGVAKNETANDISVNSQKHFDEGGFNALTLDTKTQDKIVYLTFDVGYDNGYTGMILDTLKEKNVKAAFFCTVDEMKSDPESIARMVNEGHIVGNHTETHPSMDELSGAEMMREVKAFDDYIRTNFGYSSPYFRYPKGEYSDYSLKVLGDLGYLSVFWSLAYADWDINNQKGADYALQTVKERIHPGAVILLHAVSSDNAQALGDIIDAVRAMGYEFKSLEDYNTD